MKKLALSTIGVLIFQLSLCGAAVGDELADREAIRSQVIGLIGAGRFSDLEALSSRYRSSRSRTSSGLWHLTLFYAGVARTFSHRHKEAAYWQNAADLTRKWVAAFPNSPTARLAHARMLIQRGWSHRGGGFAREV